MKEAFSLSQNENLEIGRTFMMGLLLPVLAGPGLPAGVGGIAAVAASSLVLAIVVVVPEAVQSR